jgi:hypothetical protein
MTDVQNKDGPTVISAADARGALGLKRVSAGDTMLPTLIGGLILALVAVGIVAYVVWPVWGP